MPDTLPHFYPRTLPQASPLETSSMVMPMKGRMTRPCW